MGIKTSFLTLISIASVLVLLHLFGLMYTHSEGVVDKLKERVNILVELTEDIKLEEKDKLIEELQSNIAILSSSVKYVDKQEASALLAGQFDNLTNIDSPFKNSILFNLKASHYDDAVLADLKEQLEQRNYVSDIFYQNDLFDNLKKNIDNFGVLLLIIGLLLLVFVIIIIYNTVKLSLLTDSQKIKTMSLVGAKWNYIMRPYLGSAILTGILAAFIAIVVSIFFFFTASKLVGDFSSFISWEWVFVISLIILFIGILIPYISTRRIVHNYLRKTTYD